MPDQELIAKLELKKAKLLAHAAGVDEAIVEAQNAPDPEETTGDVTVEAGVAEGFAETGL